MTDVKEAIELGEVLEDTHQTYDLSREQALRLHLIGLLLPSMRDSHISVVIDAQKFVYDQITSVTTRVRLDLFPDYDFSAGSKHYPEKYRKKHVRHLSTQECRYLLLVEQMLVARKWPCLNINAICQEADALYLTILESSPYVKQAKKDMEQEQSTGLKRKPSAFLPLSRQFHQADRD